MQVPGYYIVQVILITSVFLVAAIFLLLYIFTYNKRKRKHSEEKDRLRREFEQELVKTQMEVQEHTFKTIAGEIHDNVGQLLSLARITLSTINIPEAPIKSAEKVNHSIELLSTSIKELRELSAILYAENILASGLESAVHKEMQRLSRTEQFSTDFKVIGKRNGFVDPKKELISFRLFQELLNNSIKHSNASSIQVYIEYNSEGLKMTINDNGRGFDIEKATRNPQGLGLTNVYKRAQIIESELQLQSTIDMGTTASFQLHYLPNSDTN